METYILLAIIGILSLGVFVLLFQKRGGTKDSSILLLQNQIQDLSRTLDEKLGDSSKMFQRQYVESVRVIKDITERLTKLDQTNSQVLNFSEQLKNLQDILQNPKQRGVLGEYYLETVLKNVLPPQAYQMQYKFENGEIVDAVVIVQKKLIPIDSKFSLENYNRILQTRNSQEKETYEKLFRQDLKNRIDETAKYVRPREGTLDFAFMFIPSEAVFYDLLVNKVGTIDAKDLIEYAFREKRVIVVSPTSFLAYLQTVLQGLKALQIEESAKEIRKRVEDLGRHITSYETYMKKLGGHLGTTINSYNTAYQELGKIDKDVLRITDKTRKTMEPLELDKPKATEEVDF